MEHLILTLFVAAAAFGNDFPETFEPLKCEQRLGGSLMRTFTRMRTLRTVSSHENGVPTAALRTVLDEYLAGDFPDDVETHNDSPLPIFEIKAEKKLEHDGSKHKLMVLKASRDGQAAVIVHEEQYGDEPPVFMTMPLGADALREVREALLQAYQIDDRLAPRMADMSHLALFAEDRLRIDPTQRGGMSETAYANVLEVIVRGHQHGDVWQLNLRREEDHGSIVRLVVDDVEELSIFEIKKFHRARARALQKLEERLADETLSTETIEIYLGANAELPEMEMFKVAGERNIPTRILHLPEDALSQDLLRAEFGSVENDHVQRVGGERDGGFEVRASMSRLVRLLTGRIDRRI